MSIGLSSTNELFHGTSCKRYDSIVKCGFQLSSDHYDRFISANGIYFVANRPLVARRFALMAAREDQCEEVVLSVELKFIANNELLDLTTDNGMHMLYKGYLKLEQLFKQKKRTSAPRTPTVYELSLEKESENMELFGTKVLTRMSERKKSLNWDSSALAFVAAENNCAVMVAAIQEGTTFNKSFSHEQYTHGTSTNYHGMSYRDHIEVCVLDLALIDMKSLKVRIKEKDFHDYQDEFVYEILNYGRPDANK